MKNSNNLWVIINQLEDIFKKYQEIFKGSDIFKLKKDFIPNDGYWTCKFSAVKDRRDIDTKKMSAEEILNKLGSIRYLEICVTDHDAVEIRINGSRLDIQTCKEFEMFGKKFIEDTVAYMVTQYAHFTCGTEI